MPNIVKTSLNSIKNKIASGDEQEDLEKLLYGHKDIVSLYEFNEAEGQIENTELKVKSDRMSKIKNFIKPVEKE